MELLSGLVWTATWPVLWELEGWGRGCQSVIIHAKSTGINPNVLCTKKTKVDHLWTSQKLAGNIPAYLTIREYRSSHSLQEATPPSLRFPL